MEYQKYKLIGIIGFLLEVAIIAFALVDSWLRGWEPTRTWKDPTLALCIVGFLGLGIPLYCLEYVRTRNQQEAKKSVMLVYGVILAIIVPSFMRGAPPEMKPFILGTALAFFGILAFFFKTYKRT